MQVGRPAGEHDGRRTNGFWCRRAQGLQPGAGGFGGQVLVLDGATTGLPPQSDLLHGWQQDVVQTRPEPEGVVRLAQVGADGHRVGALGSIQDRGDVLGRRATDAEQLPHGIGSQARPLPAGDLVAHQAQRVQLGRGVPAVPARCSNGRGDVVAKLPGSQRGHRYAELAGDLGDGQSGERVRGRILLLGDLTSLVPIDHLDSGLRPRRGRWELPSDVIALVTREEPWPVTVARCWRMA